MRERRSYVRLNGLVLVNYKTADGKLEGKSSAFDISGVGLRITAAKKLAIGTPVEMEIFLPGSSQAILAKGQVTWVQKYKQELSAQIAPQGEYFYAGIEFLTIDENSKNRIINYVFRKARQLKEKSEHI